MRKGCFTNALCTIFCIIYFIWYFNIFIFLWRDIRPSMVTHTRNLCSAINPSKVHTHSSEHTPVAVGSYFMMWHPGSSWEFSALLMGTSVIVLRVERALYIHSPHRLFLPVRDSNPQPLGYEPDSLTIRPRLSLLYIYICYLRWNE